jgi:adenylate cyclase
MAWARPKGRGGLNYKPGISLAERILKGAWTGARHALTRSVASLLVQSIITTCWQRMILSRLIYGYLAPRRLRLLSGLVMFAYVAVHLLNHGLGIISLSLAESGLRLEMAFWRTPAMTLLLYGAVAIHFFLALRTLYGRRDWRLPWVEILRLAAGFSFPLLLINHAVTTRIGDAFFGIKPSYALIIANLLAAGRQGLQLALLAPGWLHGCLGLWITLRRFRTMQGIKGFLVAAVILVPLLAAAGFIRMAFEVSAIGLRPPTGADALLHKAALASWNATLMTIYLGAISFAFLLGRLRFGPINPRSEVRSGIESRTSR